MSIVSDEPRSRLNRQEVQERIIEATVELVRERSYAQLKVGEIMDRAGLERTIFYRHFENIASMLLSAGRESIEALYGAQLILAQTRTGLGADSVREAIEVPVTIYHRHGPLLRAISEAVAAEQLEAVDQEAIRRRFDELVEQTLRAAAEDGAEMPADIAETARALNLLNERYLLDAFGREPRVSIETATETLTDIWTRMLTPKNGA